MFAEAKAPFESQAKYWFNWPVGTYIKMKGSYDYEMPTGKFSTHSEYIVILTVSILAPHPMHSCT